MSLRDFTAHWLGHKTPAAVAAAAAPVIALLPFKRDWKRTMTDIDAKIADAQTRRMDLVTEREPHIMAYVAGDESAKKAADKLDRSIEDLDRELSRLHLARAKAADNIAIEETVETAERERNRLKQVRNLTKDLVASASEADEAAEILQSKLAAMKVKIESLSGLAGRDEVRTVLGMFSSGVPSVIGHALDRSGYPFGRIAFVQDGCETLASRVPDADYLAAAAAKLKGA